MMNPRGRGLVHVDANALDLDGTVRDALVRRFIDLKEKNVIRVVVPHGVRSEVQNPRTPGHVQNSILPEIFTIKTSLVPGEHENLRKIQAILQGKATPGKHAADAKHVFEAVKNGGFYFITHDGRILKKRDELHAFLRGVNPALRIVTLEEFFEVFDSFAPVE